MTTIGMSLTLAPGSIDSLISLLKILKECNARIDRLLSKSALGSEDVPALNLEIVFKKKRQADVVTALAIEYGLTIRTCEADSDKLLFPVYKKDLDIGSKRVLMYGKELDADHPGFTDAEYRRRRLSIAALAEEFSWGMKIPHINYTEQENETWSKMFVHLKELYKKYACRNYLENFKLLEGNGIYKSTAIPQLAEVSKFLKSRSGFQLYPVAGYLSSRDFLAGLAFRIFHASQYIRHSSYPFYSPEPDVCHELLGHVPMFACPEFAQFSQEIGLASLQANDELVEKLAKLYFFTIEFGLCMEGKNMKIFGAGLLSSAEEIKHVMEGNPKVLPMRIDAILAQKCEISTFQNVYFVCKNFQEALNQLRSFTSSMCNGQIVHYDPYKEKVELLNNQNVLSCVLDNIRQDISRVCIMLNYSDD